MPSRSERFFAGYLWTLTRNVLGWILILFSFVLGPTIPGPSGIPLFLIGFALITFPGKRKLTARVLRGKQFSFGKRCNFASILLSPPVAVLLLWLLKPKLQLIYRRGAASVMVAGMVGAALVWLLIRGSAWALNLLLRFVPGIRHRVRPWLRKHRIRLLPPRRRPRLSYEPGTGPLRLKDEILGILKRVRGRKS